MKLIRSLLVTASILFHVQAHRPVASIVAQELRGGGGPNGGLQNKVKKTPVIKAKGKTATIAADHHHEDHLMSAPVAIANVLADLCPHGMLPIGTSSRYCRLQC